MDTELQILHQVLTTSVKAAAAAGAAGAKLLFRKEFLLTLPLTQKNKKRAFHHQLDQREVWKVPAEPLCHLSSLQGALTAGVGIHPEKVGTTPS